MLKPVSCVYVCVVMTQTSLMSTIINLAQNFVGSNNLNLLQPLGQFGTRLHGGKDAASPRYIFTMLRSVCSNHKMLALSASLPCLYQPVEKMCWPQCIFTMLFVGCLTSQQHASVSQGRICSDNCTCCHTEIEVADQTFHLTQSQYTDTGPTSPSTDPMMPGAWQGSHWSANFYVTGMTRPRKYPVVSGIRTRDLPLPRRMP